MGIDKVLINWYKVNQRLLPWRNTRDPYIVWVSEIILQQTRIDQGTSYFLRFIDKFPNISSLANSNEDDVLLLWQGLGYYSRARNLHHTAKYVDKVLNCVFPNNYNDLLKLKGVGQYTAAAIASFCFKEKVAAIDGNVYRVITRLFNIDKPIDKSPGKKEVSIICNELIPEDNPDDFNQAMMDLGATICLPKNPLCNKCPLISKCLSRENNTFLNRPVKLGRTKQKIRYFTYLIVSDKQSTIIKKRLKNDIWKGLYEFPMIESECELTIDEIKNHKTFIELTENYKSIVITIKKAKPHVLSHQKIISIFIVIHVKQLKSKNTQMIKIKELEKYAFSTLINNFIKSNLK